MTPVGFGFLVAGCLQMAVAYSAIRAGDTIAGALQNVAAGLMFIAAAVLLAGEP